MSLEISKEQYAEWRNHPTTLFFRKFLKDRRAALINAATEAWLNNDSSFAPDECRGHVRELFNVEDVPYETIIGFYQERDNEGKNTPDHTC